MMGVGYVEMALCNLYVAECIASILHYLPLSARILRNQKITGIIRSRYLMLLAMICINLIAYIEPETA